MLTINLDEVHMGGGAIGERVERRAMRSQAEPTFRVRRLRGSEWADQALALVVERYRWRGYSVGGASELSRSGAAFGVEIDGELVATVTLRVGWRVASHQQGLACEDTFDDLIHPYRVNGERLGEYCLLATKPKSSPAVLAALFHTVHLFGVLRGVQRSFIEVNPRHADFYRAGLGFVTVSEETRHCGRADAPAVLLTVSAAHVASELEQYGGMRMGGAVAPRHSLYPLFFGRRDEAEVMRRLAAMEGDGHEVVFGAQTALG